MKPQFFFIEFCFCFFIHDLAALAACAPPLLLFLDSRLAAVAAGGRASERESERALQHSGLKLNYAAALSLEAAEEAKFHLQQWMLDLLASRFSFPPSCCCHSAAPSCLFVIRHIMTFSSRESWTF